jgi:DNA-binding GntR family transcriptional regulator
MPNSVQPAPGDRRTSAPGANNSSLPPQGADDAFRTVIPNDTFQTKSTRVYSGIKRDIMEGVYAPGTHLVRRDLVKRFGVSLSIINEALGRLSHDGLVETKEMYGTRVIALSDATLHDEFVLREAIERHVVRLLAEYASEETLAELLDEARTLDSWINNPEHDEAKGTRMHLQFHLRLARATGYQALEETLQRTGMRALLTTRWINNQRIPHPADFHEQLIRAVMQRKPELADRTMREHLHFPTRGTPALPHPPT